MISRNWKGVAKTQEADNYIKHLRTDTFPRLLSINGFIKASILKRSTDRGIEFQIITIWESMEAVKQFAGDKVNVAVVPKVVQDMMIEYDRDVNHYEIIED